MICVLNTEEKEKLGLHMYNNTKRLYGGLSLHDWERKWFSDSLPAPPQKVLVAACGAGTELKELLEMGYEVKVLMEVSQWFRSAEHGYDHWGIPIEPS